MRGRDSYLAFLIPVTDPSVVAYLHDALRTIERVPGVEPYPEDYWHITDQRHRLRGQGAGRAGRCRMTPISSGIAGAAREIFAAQPAFDVEIGPLSAFPEVVFAQV